VTDVQAEAGMCAHGTRRACARQDVARRHRAAMVRVYAEVACCSGGGEPAGHALSVSGRSGGSRWLREVVRKGRYGGGRINVRCPRKGMVVGGETAELRHLRQARGNASSIKQHGKCPRRK